MGKSGGFLLDFADATDELGVRRADHAVNALEVVFGFGAEGFIRISYATSIERLQEGIRRIRRVAESLA